MTDDRDLVIEILAASEAELRERVASLVADVASFRELAHAALDQLHALTQSHDTLRATHHRLLDQYRALCVQTLRKAAAA